MSKASEDMLPSNKVSSIKMPFNLRTWSSDNGVEFINNVCCEVSSVKNIQVIRRRLTKNDAAHVEQKTGHMLRVIWLQSVRR